jgi:hypothetical protein
LTRLSACDCEAFVTRGNLLNSFEGLRSDVTVDIAESREQVHVVWIHSIEMLLAIVVGTFAQDYQFQHFHS